MRIVLLGASRFGVRCLRAVAAAPGCELVGVVTAARTFAISYRPQGVTNVLHADAFETCRELGVACEELGSQGMKDERLLATVAKWRPHAYVVAGWYHMVPKAWRQMAPAYGLHASLLPDYRGGAPLVWAIINGEKETGITLFQFDDGVDTGPILAQGRTPISEEDTIATVYGRIEDIGVSLLSTTLPRLAAGSVVAVPQDARQGRSFPQRSPEDGLIDWTWSAQRIYDFIRAQTKPYPGAFFAVEGRRITIWSASLAIPASRLEPGEIGRAGNRVLVGTGDGAALELGLLQVEGRDVEAACYWEGAA